MNLNTFIHSLYELAVNSDLESPIQICLQIAHDGYYTYNKPEFSIAYTPNGDVYLAIEIGEEIEA